MSADIEALLLRIAAPAHLADAIVGDLYERRAELARSRGYARARAVTRAEALRSLPSLMLYRAWLALAGDWMVALPVAAIICAVCVVTIPLWDHLGMGSGVFHMLRLFVIGLILGCIPRASVLGFAFLLLLIGISDGALDARQFDSAWQLLTDSSLYRALSTDAAAMAAALAAVSVVKTIARTANPDRRSP